MPDFMTLTLNKNSVLNLVRRLEKIGGDSTVALTKAVEDGGEILINNMRKNHYFVGVGVGAAQKAKEGEGVYRNPDGSLRFKSRTTLLVKSLTGRDAIVTGREITMNVIAGMKYAAAVEFGTDKTRPFPFMRPAMEQEKDNIFKNTEKILRQALARA